MDVRKNWVSLNRHRYKYLSDYWFDRIDTDAQIVMLIREHYEAASLNTASSTKAAFSLTQRKKIKLVNCFRKATGIKISDYAISIMCSICKSHKELAALLSILEYESPKVITLDRFVQIFSQVIPSQGDLLDLYLLLKSRSNGLLKGFTYRKLHMTYKLNEKFANTKVVTKVPLYLSESWGVLSDYPYKFCDKVLNQGTTIIIESIDSTDNLATITADGYQYHIDPKSFADLITNSQQEESTTSCPKCDGTGYILASSNDVANYYDICPDCVNRDNEQHSSQVGQTVAVWKTSDGDARDTITN